MMLNKYYDISFLMQLDLYEVNILFLEALEKDREDMIHSTWRGLYPFMLSGFIKFVSLQDFEQQFVANKVCELSNEEIMDEFKEIIARDRQVR